MRIALAALVLLFGALALDAFWIEPASLRISRYDIPLKHCPPSLAGLKIAVITDLHAGAPYIDIAKIQRVVAMTNAEHADLILMPGDIFTNDVIGGGFIAPEQTLAALSLLQAPLGVYFVFGNHEYKSDTAHLKALLAASPIQFMDNSVRRIENRGLPFWLIGLPNFFNEHVDIRGTLAQVTDDAPVLLFTHSPDIFPKIPARVNLVIAGHTHGGQVDLPIIVDLANPSYFPERYRAGHVIEQTDLFVATGIGTSRIPVRFGVPPEISLLTLSQAPMP